MRESGTRSRRHRVARNATEARALPKRNAFVRSKLRSTAAVEERYRLARGHRGGEESPVKRILLSPYQIEQRRRQDIERGGQIEAAELNRREHDLSVSASASNCALEPSA